MRNIKVLIADDHNLVREALADYMERLPYVKEVRQAINGKEVLKMVKSKVPDLVLMDIMMPEMDGVECSEILLRRYPDIKIIALTAIENPRAIVKMIELGVQGYCLKNMDLEELEKAVVSVIENDFYQNPLIVTIMRNEIISHKHYDNVLTNYTINERDKRIIKLICEEKTTSEIAETICLSPRTVEKIRNDLAKKLGVRGVVGLVRFGIQNGYDL